MRVLHIISGLGDGGAEAVLYNLVKNNLDNRHIVLSLTDHGKYGPLLENLGVEVIVIGINKNFSSFFKLLSLAKAIRKYKPDVIQTWMYHADFIGGLVSWLLGCRNIVWGVHNSILTPKLSKITTLFIAKVNALTSRFLPKKIICCAEKSLKVHQALGYRNDKMIVINNGYDLSKFSPDTTAGEDFRTSLNISKETILLGAVGRYDPNKDHKNLFQALSLLVKKGIVLKCVLAGKDIHYGNSEILNLINDYGLQDSIILLGPRNDIPALMNALDLFILSSVAEAFPNVLCEAMACGIPCVSTDVGDAAIIIEQTGWVVPPSNSLKLSLAIEDALLEFSDVNNFKSRKLAARERIVENFSLERMVRSYSAIWSDVM